MDPSMIDGPPMEVMRALNIDPSAFDIAGSAPYLAKAYDLVNQMKPLYLEHRGTGHLRSYVKRSETDYGAFLKFQEYDLQIAYSPRMPKKPIAGGMVYELERDRFLLIGMQSSFTFTPKPGQNKKVEILKLEEGELVNGQWKPCRIFNGDEKMSLNLGDIPSCLMVQLYQY